MPTAKSPADQNQVHQSRSAGLQPALGVPLLKRLKTRATPPALANSMRGRAAASTPPHRERSDEAKAPSSPSMSSDVYIPIRQTGDLPESGRGSPVRHGSLRRRKPAIPQVDRPKIVAPRLGASFPPRTGELVVGGGKLAGDEGNITASNPRSLGIIVTGNHAMAA